MTTKLTKQGLLGLEEKLKSLKEKGEVLITRIEEVAQPDESGQDNLAIQLKEELEIVNTQIDEITKALESVEIIGEGNNIDFVQLGTKVTMKLSGNKLVEFNIVDELETDPLKNNISDKSPLGLALLGKKVNEQVDFEAPIGKLTYKIVNIGSIV
jgi:transcription elongation factor GreA